MVPSWKFLIIETKRNNTRVFTNTSIFFNKHTAKYSLLNWVTFNLKKVTIKTNFYEVFFLVYPNELQGKAIRGGWETALSLNIFVATFFVHKFSERC